jgi:hypothetical protein
MQVITPNEKRRNAYRMYNPMTLQELQNMTDSVQVSSPHAKVCVIYFYILEMLGDLEIRHCLE